MKPVMTREEAKAWRERWALVEEAHREELQSKPVETKLRQLAVMMHTARTMGWKTSTPAQLHRIRARWARLKRGKYAL